MMDKFARLKNAFVRGGNSVDATLLTAVKVCTAAVGLVCTKLISETFSYADYGTYSQAILCSTTITAITILGLTDAVNLFFNKTTDIAEKKKKLATIFNLQYAIGSIGALFLLLCNPLIIRYFENPLLSEALCWVAFCPLVNNLLAMQQVLFFSIHQSRVIVVRNLVVSLIKLSIYLFACFVVKDIVVIIALTLLCDSLQVVYFKHLLKRKGIVFGVRDGSWAYVRQILTFSIPMVAYVLCSSLMRDTDKYIIGKFASTETFAVYSNASKVLPFEMLTSSFATVLLPSLTQAVQKRDFGLAQRLYGNYLNLGFIVIGILVAVAIITAPELMTLLYGKKYLGGLSVFVVYLLVTLVRFSNFSFIYAAAGDSKKIMYVAILSLVANVVLAVSLFKLIGGLGCALSNLVVSLLTNAYLMYDGSKYIGKNTFLLVNLRQMLLLVVTSVILLFVYYLAKACIPICWDNAGVFILTYIFLAGLLGLMFFKPVFQYLKKIN